MTKVGVLYGGISSEYEISLRSAETIIQNLDKTYYEIVPIHINRQSEWLIYDVSPLTLNGSVSLPNVLVKVYQNIPHSLPCDVIFSVLHGGIGEGGGVQGLLDILNLPYVGAGILGSSIALNKVIAKQLVAYHNVVPIVPYITFTHAQWQQSFKTYTKWILNNLNYPVFIKPANGGSSQGIAKVKQPDALALAVKESFCYDNQLLVEKALAVREIEVAILESIEDNHAPLVSSAGEISFQHDFYSYDAKYTDNRTILKIPAELSVFQQQAVQSFAARIFDVLQGSGLARIDFFLEISSGKFYFNEMNTLPGFTSTSMYPLLWQAANKTLPELLTHLIKLAIKRYQHNNRFQQEMFLSEN